LGGSALGVAFAGQGLAAQRFFVVERVGQRLGLLGIEFDGESDDGSGQSADIGILASITVDVESEFSLLCHGTSFR
jgi:hypothetical protein